MAFSDLEQFQLAIGHFVTHPELQPATNEAVAANPGAYGGDGIDILPYLQRHGFVLPPGSTARFVRAAAGSEADTDVQSAADSSDDDHYLVCVTIGTHDWCAEIRPPIVIETP